MGFLELPSDPALREPLPDSPFPLLARWLEEARATDMANPDAMAVATADAEGRPSVRMVLCRGLDAAAGHIVFYTNRDSAKAHELAGRPYASAALYWEPLSRQARISGTVVESPPEESDAYFASRPRLSQLAAWGSRQSRPIASRDALLEQLHAVAARFGGVEGEAPVSRPPFWGGYRIVASRVELWVGSRGRAHDRVEWTREAPGADPAPARWRSARLQP